MLSMVYEQLFYISIFIATTIWIILFARYILDAECIQDSHLYYDGSQKGKSGGAPNFWTLANLHTILRQDIFPNLTGFLFRVYSSRENSVITINV